MNFLSLFKNKSTINFALLTDFGSDFAVASMKAILVKELPECTIIDIDHSIEKFSIISGAFVLEKVYRFFQENTIFIAIVDPGVGTVRDAIVVKLGIYTFVGPNNGTFHYILKNPQARVFKINETYFPDKSFTFHGRDLFIPVALQVAQGNKQVLTPLEPHNVVYLDNLEHQSLITYIDSFGNLKTNIPVEETTLTASKITCIINEKEFTIPFVTTFDQVKPGQLLCYKGSNDTLELAVNQGSAREYLHVNVGTRLTLNKKDLL